MQSCPANEKRLDDVHLNGKENDHLEIQKEKGGKTGNRSSARCAAIQAIEIDFAAFYNDYGFRPRVAIEKNEQFVCESCGALKF